MLSRNDEEETEMGSLICKKDNNEQPYDQRGRHTDANQTHSTIKSYNVRVCDEQMNREKNQKHIKRA